MFDSALPEINKGLSVEDLYATDEARMALNQMSERNELMFSGDVIYKI